jgi:hypothetical protein
MEPKSELNDGKGGDLVKKHSLLAAMLMNGGETRKRSIDTDSEK